LLRRSVRAKHAAMRHCFQTVRPMQGRRVEVTVLDRGFAHDGTVYRSLSAVAKAITGSHCNGYLFFRLARRRTRRKGFAFTHAFQGVTMQRRLSNQWLGPKSDLLGDMETQHFEIPTRDGRTRLVGQVDLPRRAGAARYPAVLMVPGGWFMDRDGYMGGSGTERDLIYRDLAKDIVAAGIAVVRYDNRGVRCNEMTMPPCPEGSNELEVSKHYLNACVDPDVRQSVTVQTQMDDVEDVWAFTVNHPAIDPRRALI